MIQYSSESIFDVDVQVITNPVNCVGIMGAGLALEFKRRYPDMFIDYRNRCSRKGGLVIGEPYLWDGKILNFPTKIHWKDSSELEYIETGLRWLQSHYEELGISSIAMPALGCGLGGLSLDDVLPIMEKCLGHLKDLNVVVCLVNSNKRISK